MITKNGNPDMNGGMDKMNVGKPVNDDFGGAGSVKGSGTQQQQHKPLPSFQK